MTNLESLGEFGLIERIVTRLGEAAARNILVPPGDDAAAWRNQGAVTVATTDALVEGVHWRSGLEGTRATMSWADAGWRAIASNVSDIAAMGAIPDFAIVSVVLGPGLDLDALDCLIDGMSAACLAHGVQIAGGDIDRGSQTVLGVTLIGHTESDALLRRDGARLGDLIAVSGHPGASSAGLALIEAGREGEPDVEALLEANRRPHARVELGRAAIEVGVRCAIDVSDGLLQDLGHIAERSGVGIEVDLDALSLSMDAVGALGVGRARDLALGGGEDYELALAGPEAALHALWSDELPVTVVGRVVAEHPGEAWALDGRGERYMPSSSGWDHLTGGSGQQGAVSPA
ncbi:MAG: thiamine-phosphate kinase [Dehalococcoidia bacterium]|nr:thiamine-phosphate kinase [Dehalococcoidia bacterium]